MIFITFNDQYSGVFQSQVLDVLDHYELHHHQEVVLLSFFPRRNYLKNVKKIREVYKGKVYSFPIVSLRYWRFNGFIIWVFLRLFYYHRPIICRGPLATFLAIRNKTRFQKVCFDARGATKAEIQEFDMGLSPEMVNSFIEAEKISVNISDFRISVSNKLVNYWINTYSYCSHLHEVIPCTVSYRVSDNLKLNREDIGFSKQDIVLIYSGGVQGWQSFNQMLTWSKYHLNKFPEIRLLLLTNLNKEIESIINEFGDSRVKQFWVEPHEVPNYLSVADYGIIIREENETNRVSSPTKFAEYLAAGLGIVISENIGDYSEMVKQNGLGHLITETYNLQFKWVSNKNSIGNIEFAKEFLNKESSIVVKKYENVLFHLDDN
jgi:hypothetical protein